jgi:hypothetical protein
MRHIAESIFVIEYLLESIFKIASVCDPGDPEVLFAEKTNCQKSRVPLTIICSTLDCEYVKRKWEKNLSEKSHDISN